MKQFYHFLLAGILVLVSASAHAQISVGAGYLNSNTIEKTGSLSAGYGFNGLYAEADYKIGLIGNFLGISPGLRYTFASSNAVDDLGIKGKWAEHYLEVPVMVDLGYDFSEKFRLFAFAGPSFSFGLSSQLSVNGINEKVDMYKFFKEFLGDGASYGRFDIMIGFGVGVDLFSHLRIKAEFDQGLLNRISGIEDSSTHRNLVKVGVAYIF